MEADELRSVNVKKALTHLRNKGWVSLRQFGYIVGISYPTVLKYREQGKFAYVWIGHTCRVMGDEVNRFLSEGTHPGSEKVYMLREGKKVSLGTENGCAPIVRKIMTDRKMQRLDDFGDAYEEEG